MITTLFELRDTYDCHFFDKFEKTGLIYEFFKVLKNLKMKFHCRKENFCASFLSSYLESAIYVTFSRCMSIEPKKAYISKCIYKCVTMYECTSVVNRAF